MKKQNFLVFLFALVVLVFPLTAASAKPVREEYTYVVQPGDYLWKIAILHNTTPAVIMQMNNLTSSLIVAGQVLKVPNPMIANPPTFSTPAPAATQPPANVPTGGNATATGGTYTVQPGDTLWRIAYSNGMTVTELMALNGLTTSIIHVGQVLKVSGAGNGGGSPAAPATNTGGGGTGTYTVQPGDTLWGIARKHNTYVSEIMKLNNLSSSIIHVGQVLTVPGGSGAPAPTQQAAAPATPAPGNPPPAVNTANMAGFSLGGQVQGFGPEAVNAMQRAGMTWVKKQIKWHPGANAQDGINQANDAHAKGFKILFSVAGYPQDTVNSNFPAYAEFVGALAGGGADAIEIWNEMNLDREWLPDLMSTDNYISMLSQAYNSIKSRNSNTLVILGALAPTGAFGGGCGQIGNTRGCDDLPYIQGLVAKGALQYADCVGIHYNEGILPPAATSGDPRGAGGFYSRYYQGMVNTYWTAVNGAKKLCFTELGYLSGEEWGYVPGNFLWTGTYNLTVAQHAQYLAEAAALSINQGRVALMIVFNVDIKTWTDDPQAGFAIIRPNGGCPACDTMGKVMGK
ncbi:MAG TPA: LysM peptidoglycan-binding domain-containing protein [Anaerolineales bacterium]|nr:LysM peptidoglycan-binding domain-containing protein [Anaerolineales bacterium]